MTAVTQLDDELHCIDLNFQGRPGVIAAYLYQSAGELALVETGPTSTLPTLLGGLDALRVDPAKIDKLVVTHIHLDHAGAAGTLMRRFPRAHLYVHPIGAPHLVDPSRLLASATRIYGATMETLWGTVEPVPEDRITIIDDGATIAIGNRELSVHYTPGHASHHVILHDVEHALLFAGDAACVRVPGQQYVRPATPPPDIDLEAWDRSLTAMERLHAETLLLTHFGPYVDIERHLQRARQQLFAWAELVEQGLRVGHDRQEIVAAVHAHADAEVLEVSRDPKILAQYDLAGPSGMSVDGYLRYFRKRAERR